MSNGPFGEHVLLFSTTLGFLGLEDLVLIKAFLHQKPKEKYILYQQWLCLAQPPCANVAWPLLPSWQGDGLWSEGKTINYSSLSLLGKMTIEIQEFP